MNHIRSKPSLALALVCFLFFASIAVVRWTPLGEPTPVESPPLSGAEMLPEAPADEAKAGATAQKLANEQPRQPTASSAPESAATSDKFREVYWPTFAHPAILEREQNGRIFHQVANHLLVTIESPEALPLLDEWANAKSDHSTERLVAETYLVEWNDTSARAHVETKAHLQAVLGKAAVVEPNWIVRKAAEPQGDRFAQQRLNFVRMFAQEGWMIRTDARNIVVAVVDSGIDYTHPDLVTRVRPRPGEIPNTGRDDNGNGFIDDVYGWDFVENNNTPMDRDGHGTHVAGIIGADGTNSIFGTGVAWDVTLLPVRFLDDEGRGTIANEIKSLDYARVSGAHIVNASYGGAGYSHAVLTRLQALNAAGIWFVTSAGNDGIDIDVTPAYPASYNVPNVIAVAALDVGDSRSLSNYGINTVPIAAPGSNVFSTDLNDGFTSRSGTSMSAAFVSGALALILAEFPGASPAEVRARLTDRTRFSSALERKVGSGGWLDLEHSLRPGPGRAPTVSMWPLSAFRAEGATFNLYSGAASSKGSVIEWLLNGEVIPGETGRVLRIPSLSTEHEGLYQSRVVDLYGEVTSDPVPVYLESRISIKSENSSGQVSIPPGHPATLSVHTEPFEAIAYQWFFEGDPISGAVEPHLSVSGASTEHAGSYFVRLITPFGHFDSPDFQVAIDPFGNLQWKLFADLPPVIDTREGAYYLGWANQDRVYSSDLISWDPLPLKGVQLFFRGGEYFLVDHESSIYRGLTLATLELWLTQEETSRRGRWPEAFLRNGSRLLIHWTASAHTNTFATAEVIDLNTRDRNDPAFPFTHDPALSSSVGGYFWRFIQSPRGVQRSTNGIDWDAVPEKTILPLWQDEETGWAYGREFPPSTGLHVRSPGGEWQPMERPGTSSLISQTQVRGHFPGGLLLGTPTGGFTYWLMDFRTGELREFDGGFGVRNGSVSQRSRARSQVFWCDHDFLLSREAPDNGDLLLREEKATGGKVVIFPGVARSTINRDGIFFQLSEQGFYTFENSLYSALRGHGLKRIHADKSLRFEGSNGRFALLSMSRSSQPPRIFRLDAMGELLEITSLLPEDQRMVGARGKSFVARTRVNPSTGNAYIKTTLTSEDGISWKSRGDLPDGVEMMTANRHALFAMQLFSAADGGGLRIFRRFTGATSWDVVLEVEDDSNLSRLVANRESVLFRAGGLIYSSRDGSVWNEVPEPPFISLSWNPGQGTNLYRQTDPHLLANGWFVSQPAGISGYASKTGEVWFPYFHKGYITRLIVGGIAFRMALYTDLEFARMDGGAPNPAEVEKISIFRDGRLVKEVSPAAFPVEISEPHAGIFTYRLEAVYRHGRYALSDDIPIQATLGRRLEVQTVPHIVQASDLKVCFFPSAEGFYAYANTGIYPLYHLIDGSHWTLKSYGLGKLTYKQVLEPTIGAPLLVNAATSGEPWLAMRLEGAIGQPLQSPSLFRGDSATFLHDGQVHLLDRNRALSRLGVNQSWVHLRTLVGFPAPNEPAFTVSSRVTVFSGKHLHAIVFGGKNEEEEPVVARMLTRDFLEFWPLPDVPEYRFEGIWPDADEMLYLSTDRRRLIFVDEHGHQQPGGITFQRPVEKLSILQGGTVVGETYDGVSAFLGSRTGRVWPIPTGVVPSPSYLRDATRLGVFGEKGTYFFLALQDFHVRALAEPEVLYGPLNSLRSWVQIDHQGGLSTGEDVALSVRAWLEPVECSGVGDLSRRTDGGCFPHAAGQTALKRFDMGYPCAGRSG